MCGLNKFANGHRGRVEIRMLPKNLSAHLAQHWELARKGIVDITWGNFYL